MNDDPNDSSPIGRVLKVGDVFTDADLDAVRLLITGLRDARRILLAAVNNYDGWAAEQAEDLRGAAFVIAEPGWVEEARAFLAHPPHSTGGSD